MSTYQDTITWKKILGNGIEYKKECELLKVEYEKFRDKAKLLASEIASVLPNYTVHDISHVDALWDMTDIFLPENYPISPAECFVLGGAFIIHDLGMGIAAYPEGIKGIQKESIWKDTVAQLSKESGVHYDFDRPESIDREIDKIATDKTLRILHAQKAQELAKMSWKDCDGKDIFLIDDKNLRDAYGSIIGQIAQSHGKACEELSEMFATTLGTFSSFPHSWSIDPLKLACILRVADAMQIDDRRAPYFLKAIRNLDKVSEEHWVFQDKLYKPTIEKSRIKFTSKSSFTLQEIDAWWLCHDTLQMIDKELKNVDAILMENGRQSFNIVGVYGIDSLEQIQKLITVDGWTPVDTSIRVNNVAKIVSTLGGMQLYGENNIVPLRELVQNSSDAIRARRAMDNEPDTYGDIYLSWGSDNGVEYIQIEDNGIGMSSNVMVDVLLDFGHSFWGTEQMHRELPGLEQKSFKATGKFGIGFFSVFMWGEHSKIISNRYDKAREHTMVLEFVNGVNSIPILRKATVEERIKNGGTKIKIWLSSKSINDIFNNNRNDNMSVKEKIARMCFSLDCNLHLSNEKDVIIVKANDWLTMGKKDFLQRLLGKKNLDEFIEKNSEDYKLITKTIKKIEEDDGRIVGRACIFVEPYRYINVRLNGIVTVDGFATSRLHGIIGVLKGCTDMASRDIALPIVSQSALNKWVEEQEKLISSLCYSDERQIEIVSVLCSLSMQKPSLKIARWKEKYVSYSEIVEIIKEQNYDQYYIVQDAVVENYESTVKKQISLYDNVFACDMGMSAILQTNHMFFWQTWPKHLWEKVKKFHYSVVEYHLINAIAEAWGCSFEDLLKVAQFTDDDKRFNVVIGKIDEENIVERVNILNKVTK